MRQLVIGALMLAGPLGLVGDAEAPSGSSPGSSEPATMQSAANKYFRALQLIRSGDRKGHARLIMDLMMEAADEGFPLAQSHLAHLSFSMDPDWDRDSYAVELAHKAADQGDGMGMSILAIAYAEGRGAERNDEEAHMWRLLAGEKVKVAGQSIDELDQRLTPALRAKAEARAQAWRRAHPQRP
jgi:hypothetical protein